MKSTSEVSTSIPQQKIIEESHRLEENLLYSSKSHYVTASFWKNFNLSMGLATVILSGLAGASSLGLFYLSPSLVAGVLVTVLLLTSILTFFNPLEKSTSHFNCGNNYGALLDEVRLFRTIECWTGETDQFLTGRLKTLQGQKNSLNSSSPQIPRFCYKRAKKAIANGEGEFSIDQTRPPVVSETQTKSNN